MSENFHFSYQYNNSAATTLGPVTCPRKQHADPTPLQQWPKPKKMRHVRKHVLHFFTFFFVRKNILRKNCCRKKLLPSIFFQISR